MNLHIIIKKLCQHIIYLLMLRCQKVLCGTVDFRKVTASIQYEKFFVVPKYIINLKDEILIKCVCIYGSHLILLWTLFKGKNPSSRPFRAMAGFKICFMMRMENFSVDRELIWKI